jgi:hypothetical protein
MIEPVGTKLELILLTPPTPSIDINHQESRHRRAGGIPGARPSASEGV